MIATLPRLRNGALAILGLAAAAHAGAATYTVLNTNDSGAGSLRQAITAANLDAISDTIAFNIPGSGLPGQLQHTRRDGRLPRSDVRTAITDILRTLG
jgi:hypothetical protein